MKQKSKARMYPYRRLLRYPLGQWHFLVPIFGLTAAISAVTVLQPWPMKILVDYALGGAPLPASLRSLSESISLSLSPVFLVMVAGGASLGIFLLNSALDTALTWVWSITSQRMVYDLAGNLFQRLQRLSLLFHNRYTVGDSLSRLMGDSYCVYTLTDNLLITPGKHLLTLATIGTVAWNLNPSLALLSLAVAPAMAGSALFFGARLKRRTRLNREAQSQVISFVHQTFSSIPVVQAFGTENSNAQQFRRLAGNSVTLSQRRNLINSAYRLANSSMTTLGTALILYLGGLQVISGAMTVGSLLVFLAYLRSMQGSFKGLLATYGNLKSTEAQMDRVLEVLEADEEVGDTPGARILPLGGCGHLCLEGVTFGYQPGYPVLKDITLEAQPGETIALVGATGAGKSTLVSLIPRFFDPWEGRILFDGIDARQVQLKSLRAQVALMLQEPFLLPLTVRENIAYGRPGASQEEIFAAAKAANADEFIQRLPKGYDTIIGEQGANLSGGQKQRLAIARTLLKDASVLILDEPTSALDTQTEAKLLEALERLMAGRTTFIIAHRLSSIRQADRIVVLAEGKVAEVGTHQELMSAQGVYHRFYSFQQPSVQLEGIR